MTVEDEAGDRLEHDSLGDVVVPADALYGAHTVRAVQNFALSGRRLRDRPELVASLAEVKSAAASANVACQVLDGAIGGAIVAAAGEVAGGHHLDAFLVELVHGGGGTAANMNTNEVLANLAEERLGGRRGEYRLVHPNDHVNRSQSTNDVYPTALALATVRVGRGTVAGARVLADSLLIKAGERALSHLGRTCLQDAVPLTVEQTHRAQAAAVGRAAAALERALGECLEVPLGATAVGTGIGAPSGYRERAVEALAGLTGLPVRPAGDPFAALQNLDGYLDVAAQALRLSTAMSKIAADLRFLCSPPVGEVVLPAVQVGSSIMPGKVNPVMPELVMQVGFEIRGMVAVVHAAAAAGELELNVMEPVITKHLLDGLADLGKVCVLFAQRCVDGLRWDAGRVGEHLSGSRAAAVEQAGRIGYARVAAAAQEPPG